MRLTTNSFLFVANWKMNLNYHETIAYATLLHSSLSIEPNNLVICPSFVTLSTCATILKNSSISIGAQTCSSEIKGAYTGQIDALSLAQVGCTYCIVGHSEYQKLTQETDLERAKKVTLLIKNNIIPLICIGETTKMEHVEHVIAFLEGKIAFLAQNTALKSYTGRLIIAYEPHWTIGSGGSPESATIATLLTVLREKSNHFFPHAVTTILYGGGITEENAAKIIHLQPIDGLLLGSASLDFQKLQNIVSLRKMIS